MFESLVSKFIMDYAAKIVVQLATVAMTAGYISGDQKTTITGGALAAIGALVTAGFKIANAKAAGLGKK